MSIMHLTTTTAWQLAGWTMLHYLWLGTAVALVAAALRLALRRAAPNVRYTVLLAMLGLLAAGPLGIAMWLAMDRIAPVPVAWRPAANGSTGPAVTSPIETTPNTVKDLRSRIRKNSDALSKIRILANPATATTENWPPNWTTAGTVLPWLVTWLPWLWIVGAPFSFALLATGLIGTERLRRDCQPLTDGPVTQACQRLARTLGMARPAAVAICDRLTGPVLVGVVRPLILLPPAALTGWSPDEIEMVLLHELAHIRRYDNLVNLLQRTVEGLLFFHPAVWILSHWVRLEREASCDALVVAHTGQPRQYAQLLVALAEAAHGSSPAMAAAMASQPLAGRIRRILKLEDEKMLVSRRTVAMVALGLLVSLTLVACYRPSRTAAEPAGVGTGENGAAVAVAENSTLAKAPFLSLEDQRQADLAYRVLELELEPLSQDELARVRAKGFDSGLRVASSVVRARDGVQTGDLLVGGTGRQSRKGQTGVREIAPA